MASSDSSRYDEAGSVKPKNSRTASTGSVHDPRSGKYPSTISFASSKEENRSLVEAGIKSRRPGGSLRARRGLSCSCGKHPCVCNQHAHACHDNVNV